MFFCSNDPDKVVSTPLILFHTNILLPSNTSLKVIDRGFDLASHKYTSNRQRHDWLKDQSDMLLIGVRFDIMSYQHSTVGKIGPSFNCRLSDVF